MDRGRRNRILLVLFTGVLMGALDIAIVGPVLPDLQEIFGVDQRAIAWVYGVYILAGLAGTPLMAKLADTRGRRRVYVANVLLFAVASAGVAFSGSFPQLLVARAVQGFAAGGITPVAVAVIGDVFPPSSRGRALGMLGAVFGAAFVIGPLLAGILLRIDWRWLFLVNIPVAALVVAGAFRYLPVSTPDRRRVLDLRGLVFLVIGLSAFTLIVNTLDVDDLRHLLTAQFMVLGLVAVVGLGLFRRAEARAADPILPMDVLATRQARLALALGAAVGVMEAAIVFVPDMLVTSLGVSKENAPLMLIPMVAAMTIGAPAAGRAVDWVGSRRAIMFGAAVLTVGMLSVSVMTTVERFYVSAFLAGLGMMIILGAPLRYILLSESPPDDRSSAQGGLNLAISVGQLTGGALVGATIASFGSGAVGYQAAFRVLAVLAFFMFAASFGLKSRDEERRRAHATAAVDAA